MSTPEAAVQAAFAAFIGMDAWLFPDGVCDWEVPGAQQKPALGTWQSFGPRP